MRVHHSAAESAGSLERNPIVEATKGYKSLAKDVTADGQLAVDQIRLRQAVSQRLPAHARPDATLKVRIKGFSKLGGSLAVEDVRSTQKGGCFSSTTSWRCVAALPRPSFTS